MDGILSRSWNTMAMIFPASGIQNSLGVGEQCFHCIHFAIIWLIYISVPVMILERNVSGCASWSPKFSSGNWTLWCFWTGVTIRGTQWELIFSMPRQLQGMARTDGFDMPHYWIIVEHISWVVTSTGLPDNSHIWCILYPLELHRSVFLLDIWKMQHDHTQPRSVYE